MFRISYCVWQYFIFLLIIDCKNLHQVSSKCANKWKKKSFPSLIPRNVIFLLFNLTKIIWILIFVQTLHEGSFPRWRLSLNLRPLPELPALVRVWALMLSVNLYRRMPRGPLEPVLTGVCSPPGNQRTSADFIGKWLVPTVGRVGRRRITKRPADMLDSCG